MAKSTSKANKPSKKEQEEIAKTAENIGEIDIDLNENPAVKEALEEKKISVPTVPTIQRVLFAVDSYKLDDKIKEASNDPMKKVTVLVKEKFSKANVNKYLESASLKLMTDFGIQFEDLDFDVAYVEPEMMEKVPIKILEKLNS